MPSTHITTRMLLAGGAVCATAAGLYAVAFNPPAAPASAPHVLYVSQNGADNNPGTETAPFKTIVRASRAALPGTSIRVAPGRYEGGFKTTVSGSEMSRIYYISAIKWAARIVPPSNSSSDTAWDNRGNYVDIDGFEVDGGNPHAGTRWTHGIYNGGSYNDIRRNHVHDIARDAPCNGADGSGIGVDSYYRGEQTGIIGNSVHDIGAPGCKTLHGIYIGSSGSARNNVVYAIGGAAIQMWHDANNVIVAYNTVSNASTGILVGGGDYYHARGPNDFTIVFNNIVYDNKVGISEQGATGIHNSYRNNLVFRNSSANWDLRNGLAHEGTVGAEPQFVRYSRAGTPDFSLLKASPAIGKANQMHAPEVDFDGRPRSLATGYDIGAYQH
ncbi:MAG: choice-of-anchor Q domain-containing protein [Pseudomonadota bacterium]